MKVAALVTLCVAALAVATAQSTFPFYTCQQRNSPYSLSPVKSVGNNTYCFTLNVNPIANATSYCSARADVKKFEFFMNKECAIAGTIRLFLNGAPTKQGPSFDTPKNAPADARVLRVSDLGLNLTNGNGATLCLALSKNAFNRGCATLEELCATTPGLPAGVCSVALFDSQQDCCPISRVGVPSPPPPPPVIYPPPPPPPAGAPCTTCIYASLNDGGVALFPLNLTETQCQGLAEQMFADLRAAAAATGAVITSAAPNVTCYARAVKACFQLRSQADGPKLQPAVGQLTALWLDYLQAGQSCPAWLFGHTPMVIIGGDGPDPANPPPSSCLSGQSAVACITRKVPFPKYPCDKSPRSTRFAALPVLTSEPGRPSNKTNSTLYCFSIKVIAPGAPTSACGKITTLSKAEIWADDSPTMRRKVLSLAVQAAGTSKLQYPAPSWGKAGEQALKLSTLDWTVAQADGARICMELTSDTSLGEFCNTNAPTCWLSLFSADRACCPGYGASILPY